jgi:hypothetical protein
MKNKIKNYKNQREDINFPFMTDLKPGPTVFKEGFDKHRRHANPGMKRESTI